MAKIGIHEKRHSLGGEIHPHVTVFVCLVVYVEGSQRLNMLTYISSSYTTMNSIVFLIDYTGKLYFKA